MNQNCFKYRLYISILSEPYIFKKQFRIQNFARISTITIILKIKVHQVSLGYIPFYREKS